MFLSRVVQTKVASIEFQVPTITRPSAISDKWPVRSAANEAPTGTKLNTSTMHVNNLTFFIGRLPLQSVLDFKKKFTPKPIGVNLVFIITYKTQIPSTKLQINLK
jgi:hypothetical protein